MSVVNNQDADQTTFNNAFLSRLTNSDTIGVVGLNNGSSGGLIANAQLAINRSTPLVVATQSVAASGSINYNTTNLQQIRYIQGDGAAITVSSTIFGNAGDFLDGTMITLICVSDTFTVTIENSSSTQYGQVCNGDMELKRYYQVTFLYSGVLERWIQISQNF